MTNEAVIVGACRTAIGSFQGSLSSLSATELGAIVVREAVRRAGVDPASVNEVIIGNVLSAGLGQNPARQAALRAGLPAEVGGLTINKVCGSGLKAVMLAAQSIRLGEAEVAVAGGMESMSNAPYLLPQMRGGTRMGNTEAIDSMIRDGLWCAFENAHMGNAAELVARKYAVSRSQQDEYACESHRRAVVAASSCQFKTEIVPVSVTRVKSEPMVADKDERPRPHTSVEDLAKLKPAFERDGTVTAGNAPGVNDGAAALVLTSVRTAERLNLKPIARVVAQAVSGIEPALVLMSPISAFQKVLEKTRWRLSDIDLIELNEAFAVQAVAVIRELGLDPSKVNVRGGAVALGHPIGASGARILVTLLHALRDRGGRRGVATLCMGGGNGLALAVEML
jgi:acetyl-CoA C-acetyltransferase